MIKQEVALFYLKLQKECALLGYEIFLSSWSHPSPDEIVFDFGIRPMGNLNAEVLQLHTLKTVGTELSSESYNVPEHVASALIGFYKDNS